jgi:ATP-dependent Clp protease ATP-binding subunit ClpB
MRIRDAALVAAAVLRPLHRRLLPGRSASSTKARRLAWRSTRRRRAGQAERRVTRLEIELAAMAKESPATREPLEKELAEAKARRDELAGRWANEKDVLDRVKEITRRIDELRMEAERAERGGDLARVAEIRYGLLPELERELSERAEPEAAPMVKEEVDEDDIAAVVAQWTGIPTDRLLEGEVEKLVHGGGCTSVVGQEAIEAVSNALRRARSGLYDPNRRSARCLPRPDRRGKTELAKALAEFMLTTTARSSGSTCPSTRRSTRSPDSSARLGLRRLRGRRQLTEVVRRRPYSVILPDEIEKAHAEVSTYPTALDGRLTDGHGRTVDFRNTVVIMTSNIRSADDMADRFRPEFLNRIDEIVVFDLLARAARRDRRDAARASERAARRGDHARADRGARELIGRGRLGSRPRHGPRSVRSSGCSRNPGSLQLLEGSSRRRHDPRARSSARSGLPTPRTRPPNRPRRGRRGRALARYLVAGVTQRAAPGRHAAAGPYRRCMTVSAGRSWSWVSRGHCGIGFGVDRVVAAIADGRGDPRGRYGRRRRRTGAAGGRRTPDAVERAVQRNTRTLEVQFAGTDAIARAIARRIR